MSHKPAKPIQQQIAELIQRRINRLNAEIKDFDDKRRGEEDYYGLSGGNARRYEKCIETRENEIEQLEALGKSYGGPINTKVSNIRYRYRCADCGQYIETRTQVYRDYIECPFCQHGISKITENRVEHEVIVPPMPNYYDNFSEWRRSFE